MESSRALVIVILAFMLLVACYAIAMRVLEHAFDSAPAPGNQLEKAREREAFDSGREAFDIERIMRHVEHLAYGIGPRRPASKELDRAAAYVLKVMSEAGYDPTVQSFDLPGGGKGQNIVVDKRGKRGEVLILAAHLDTVEGCPGANDDASGIGAVLEIARVLRHVEAPISLRFLFLGAEETISGGFDGHSFSAVSYLASLAEKEKRTIAGCVVLDKIGVGSKLAILHINGTDRSMAGRCLAAAETIGHPTGISSVERWSAHMPFEDAGIPTAWIEWQSDPNLHKPSDVPNNLDEEKIEVVVRMVLAAIRSGLEKAQ